MLTIGGKFMIEITKKIPAFIQNNRDLFQPLLKLVTPFFEDDATEVKEEKGIIVAIKDDLTRKEPYQNNSYSYLKLEEISPQEFHIYMSQTEKNTDKNQLRSSDIQTLFANYYIDRDGFVHEVKEEQHICDQETKDYLGFLFRTIDAKKTETLYQQNQLVKKEIYYGKKQENFPYLHQAIQNSCPTRNDYFIQIDCPFYDMTHFISDGVYIRKLYDLVEGEKFFLTSTDNVDSKLNVVNENLLVPIDLPTWNRSLGVMTKS